MTLFSYEIFDAVARQGSFNSGTAAAPDPIGHQSRHCRNGGGTGFALFSRGKNGVSMTNYGASLYPSIRDVLTATRPQAEHRPPERPEKGKVKLGVFNSVCASAAGPAQKLYDPLPADEVEGVSGHYDDVKEWLRTGQVDIAFLSSTCREEFNLTELFREPLLCIVPQDWLRTGKRRDDSCLMNGQSFVYSAMPPMLRCVSS